MINNSMKHLHHILPKYLGGTDDPENLIELTVEEHAEAHRLLFERHGNWQDYCAWMALSVRIGKGRRAPGHGKRQQIDAP